MTRITLFLFLLCTPVAAETVVAVRTIAANSVIQSSDLVISERAIAGGETDPMLFIGMEARVALYAGRAIKVGDVGPPAIVERNQSIPLAYSGGGISIRTEGRSLARAGPGDLIRVMNIGSRTTVMATLGSDGVAYVQGVGK